MLSRPLRMRQKDLNKYKWVLPNVYAQKKWDKAENIRLAPSKFKLPTKYYLSQCDVPITKPLAI